MKQGYAMSMPPVMGMADLLASKLDGRYWYQCVASLNYRNSGHEKTLEVHKTECKL